MNNLEMLFFVAYERLKESGKKVKAGSYVFSETGRSDRPLYIYYSLDNKEGMDVLSVVFASAEWVLVLDIAWTEEHTIYSIEICGEEADSLCPRNIWLVVPEVNITMIENSLLWWLTKTVFPEQEDEDEYI